MIQQSGHHCLPGLDSFEVSVPREENNPTRCKSRTCQKCHTQVEGGAA